MSHGLKIVNAASSQDMTQQQKCKQKSLWREEKCSKNQKRSQGGSNKRIEEKTTGAQFSKPGKLSATTDTANVTEQDKGKRRLYILTQGDGQQVQTINASKTKQVCTQKREVSVKHDRNTVSTKLNRKCRRDNMKLILNIDMRQNVTDLSVHANSYKLVWFSFIF